MPTEHSAPGSGPTRGPASSSVCLPASDQFFHGIPLSDGTKSMVLGVYDDARRAVHGYNTDLAPSIGSLEPVHLRSLPIYDEQAPNTGQDPEGTLGQALGNHNRTFVSEGGDPEEAPQLVAGEEADPDGTTLRTKHISTWMMVLILGVLSIILVPGLILGFVTRQVEWGIALSSAIGTIVGVFAGLYYYHKK